MDRGSGAKIIPIEPRDLILFEILQVLIVFPIIYSLPCWSHVFNPVQVEKLPVI